MSASTIGCIIACGLLAAGCGGAGGPGSTAPPPPPSSAAPSAPYPAGVAAPLGRWRSAAAPVGALRVESERASAAVGAAAVPPPLRRANAALLRSIDLTARAAGAIEARLRDWPLAAGRPAALGPAARGVRRWTRALAAETAPVPGWSARLAAASASLADAAGAALAPPTLRPGDAGPAVARVQRRLAALRYLPAAGVTREYDDRTLQAVVAVQGWEGLPRDGIAGPATLARLRTAAPPRPWSVSGRHMEIHKAQQVLLLVDAGAVVRAIHVSTAAPGHVTPDGTFAIYRKEVMSWSVPFQVWMPYASYFSGGYAIHEYPDVPPYPASHGCVRVPASEALVVWDFATIGTPVSIGE